ncbi:response regulator transcription factor [Pedobacter mucosus]|uniref:response regulator transcription factor n=1 Tax=Pedobacter mucosus TaxID=2895286 RepID=UPI001EE40088|nr:response regulator transcription factor [Pedobacter mucosus]UKT62897.1 response regulator transcription factor [Pedobacter mucosus]
MNTPIKVLLADDHVIVRNGIISLLEKESSIEVIAEVSNGQEVIEFLKDGNIPDVILTDVNMPIMNGLELTIMVKANYPTVKVLMLTILDQENYIIQSFEAGASGYLLKNVNIAEIIFAINQLYLGYNYICTSIGMNFLVSSKARFSVLAKTSKTDVHISKREIDILRLIAEGYTNSEIADKLYTSKRTIEGNRQSLLDKTGKKNTAALINFVVRNGLID